MSGENTDRAQVAALSTSARTFLITIETMRRVIEEISAERDEAIADRDRMAEELRRVQGGHDGGA